MQQDPFSFKHIATLLLTATALMAFCARAHAANTPGFATLDRADSGSRLEPSLAIAVVKDGPDGIARLDHYGQFVAKNGLGGYAALPFSIVIDENSATGVGNLELGALYSVRGKLPIVLRAGLVLDTASSSLDTRRANAGGALGRLSELPSVTSEQKWLRLGISPMWRHRAFYVRGDAGLDIPVSEGDPGRPDALTRFNVGAGLIFSGIATTLELVTVGVLGEVNDGERFVELLTFGVRRSHGTVRPFAALTTPLDDAISPLRAVLTFGVQIHLDR